MDLISVISGLLLAAPPLVIAGFWWSSVRPGGRTQGLPDGEVVIMARLGGFVCALLPVLQLFTGLIRYRTGALGHYLWYAVPGFGLLLALVAVAAFLSHARGYERPVSCAMILLSVCTLLLLTLTGAPPAI